MTPVLADTSVWVRIEQPAVAQQLLRAVRVRAMRMVLPIALELLSSARDAADLVARARRYDALRSIDLTPSIERRARDIQVALAWRGYHRGPSPTDLIAAAAAESAGAELWHCDRHFDLIGEVTGQPMRRLGE